MIGYQLFPETIETDRLRLERLDQAASVLEQYEYVKAGAPSIEEVTEYVTWEPHETPMETRSYLEQVTTAWEDGTGVGYAVVPRDGEPRADQFAGSASMSIDWDRRSGTFGLWLRKPFWGRGYSAERAGAFLQLAFERLDLELVAVTHRVGNARSRRAIEKYVDRFGGGCDGTFRNFRTDQEGETVDSVRYTIPQEAWAANRPENTAVSFD